MDYAGSEQPRGESARHRRRVAASGYLSGAFGTPRRAPRHLRGPLGLKGWAWGACGLNGLKLARAANSLNGLKRLNGVRESSRGRWSGRLPVDAGGREAGYSQLARVPYASMAPASAPD